MSSNKFREIVIRPNVTLPAISTLQPERPYSFLSFLREWVLGARGMKRDDNLEHLFEWEEVLDAFTAKMNIKAEAVEPKMPPRLEMPKLGIDGSISSEVAIAYNSAVEAQQLAYNEASEAYTNAVAKASVGEMLYVSDAAFKAGKEAAKQALDLAGTPNERGQTAINKLWESKVLRHYHAMGQSKCVEENDIPKAVSNGKAEVSASAG